MFNRRDSRQFLSAFEQREPALDFVRFGETSGFVFGEQQDTVGNDIELAAAARRDLNLFSAARLQ